MCAGIGWLSYTQGTLLLVYVCLLGIGLARAFQRSALAALTAQVVPPEQFTNAATRESGIWQASAIIGPALGGLMIAWQESAAPVYVVTAGFWW
ncbi:MAG: hypothetical protein U0401_20505 [Anaerolineae bacterium]